jgi:hypothetical protein
VAGHRGRLLEWIDERAGEDLRLDLVELELEGRDDTDAPTATPEGPEEVGIRRFACPHEFAVGGDDVDRPEVVAGEAVLPAKPADAPAQG